jgi:FixJ family two-component response regulator
MPHSLVPPAAERPILILVEDDDGVRRSLQLLLFGRGFEVRSFASAAAALADPAALDAHYLVADYRLPESDGVTLLAAMRERGWTGRAVLITAYPSDALQDAAHVVGFNAVIEKPLRQQDLLGALNSRRSN